MTSSTYLASAAVMGVLAVAVGVVVLRGRPWYRPAQRQGESTGGDRLIRSLRGWLFGFSLLAFAAIGVTLAAASGETVLMVAVGGIALAALVAVGVYAVGRANGHPTSHAVGEALVALGGLGLIAVVAWLLTSFGA